MPILTVFVPQRFPSAHISFTRVELPRAFENSAVMRLGYLLVLAGHK